MSILVCLVCAAAVAFAAAPVSAQCVDEHPWRHGYNIYDYNTGVWPRCIQDVDMDLPELADFLAEFGAPTPGVPVIADIFNIYCEPDHVPHGVMVETYFDHVYSRWPAEHVEMATGTWAEKIQYIAANYGPGTVVNLSTGPGYGDCGKNDIDCCEAVEAAYAAGVVLVGAAPVFMFDDNCVGGIADKVLRCWWIDAEGEFVAAQPPSDVNNVAGVAVPSNWYNDDPLILKHVIRKPPGYGWGSAYVESGSFSTPLLAGAIQHIADVVASRGVPAGDFVETVLDYAISGCDRVIDESSYQHTEGIGTSFGPWSQTRGYGVFSAWKALIYAYGYGRLEATDHELDPDVVNPTTDFSDHFELRGDLLVPGSQSFRISPLATISVKGSSPEGPNLGEYPTLQEIYVAGDMVVESSLEVPFTPDKRGVTATVVVGDGGSCTVADEGTITIDAGQVLYVKDGGELNLASGGTIEINNGGVLCISGEFNHYGTLILNSGSQTFFTPTSAAYLGADVHIAAGAFFLGSSNVTTVAATDAMGTGDDPARVEIRCEGEMDLFGWPVSPPTFKCASAGAGQWAGIALSPTVPGITCNLDCVHISDAVVGLAVGGSSAIVVNGIVVADCGTGVKISNRSDVDLNGGEISGCTDGVVLSYANVDIDAASIHDNNVGIDCTASDPVVRGSMIYANHIGIVTHDSNSIPNLGTVADPGNNNFHGPNPKYPGLANDYHITPFDPANDIYAQKNWWGTTKSSQIAARIVVIDAPPQGAGSVIYSPWLTSPPLGGLFTVSGEIGEESAVDEAAAVPGGTYLAQNQPNPFNPNTTIGFGLDRPSEVSLKIFDVTGRLVRELASGEMAEGRHALTWDGTDTAGASVGSGIYFYRLTAGTFSQTRKMILLK